MLWLSRSPPSGPRYCSPYSGEGWLLTSQLHPLQELPLAKENHLMQVYNPSPRDSWYPVTVPSGYKDPVSLPPFTSEGSPSFRAPCEVSRGPCCNCLEVHFLSLTHPAFLIPSRCVPENTPACKPNSAQSQCSGESDLRRLYYKYLSWLSFMAVVDPVRLYPAPLCWIHMPVPQLLEIPAVFNSYHIHMPVPQLL